MDNEKLVEDFYAACSRMLDQNVTAESTLVGDLKLISSEYYMILVEMEELGAEDVTYSMLSKCETMADAARLLLDNLDE